MKDRMKSKPENETFDRVLRDVDEVLRLHKRMPAVLEERTALAFDGFGDLLDHVLPHDRETVLCISRALRISEELLLRLRAGQQDPVAIPAGPLAMVAQAIGIDWPTFAALVSRDHARFATERELLQTRELGGFPPFLAACQAAWDREAMDDAAGL